MSEQQFQQLSDYLQTNFGIEVVRSDPLKTIKSFMCTDPRQRRKILNISADLDLEEQIFMGVHGVSHLFLGHLNRPFKTILEPRDPFYQERWVMGKEFGFNMQADSLARAILNGQLKEDWVPPMSPSSYFQAADLSEFLRKSR